MRLELSAQTPATTDDNAVSGLSLSHAYALKIAQPPVSALECARQDWVDLERRVGVPKGSH